LIKGLGRGGAENLLLHATQLRDASSFEYEVAYLLPWKTALVEDIHEVGVPVHLLSGSRVYDLRWAMRLRRLLASRRFDVVHIHSPYVASIARIVARSLPRRLRPRLMSTEHLPWSGYKTATRIMNAATFRLDAAHVAVSHAVRESIPKPLRSGVRSLVHGIPIELTRTQVRLRAAVRRELDIAPDELLIGTVASMARQKGYFYLLDAARLVLDRHPGVRFAAVGQGPLEDEIRRRHRELDLGDRFLLLGPRDRATDFIAACDVFALSSLYEGLPLVIMEALTLGVPVVGTSVTGITELVDHDVQGLLVPAARPDLFADALSELVSDPVRRARMARAAASSAERFDNQRAVRALESMYRELAEARRGSSRDGLREVKAR
jgi:glycosyltransferase involved in cell wall biosynthesis